MSTAYILSGILIGTFFWMAIAMMSLPTKKPTEKRPPFSAAQPGGR